MNEKLHNFLTNNTTQNIIRMFYPTRDVLQHRQFVRGLRYHYVQDGVETNLFTIPAKTIEWIKTISPNDNGKGYGFIFEFENMFCVEANLFTKKLFQHFADIVNCTLSNIEWDEYIKDFDKDIVNELHESKRKFQNGVGNFLQKVGQVK
ncbi:hypothetical protein SAMN00017405_0892 [Desulfonispora thiosulfatigenes DSM 11270]|uniref:Uncharacterized protein n=1 Tax=Desulfonispora thiosulfatigenes DSM 11270 TaxID=656914 RepID=A0A1W1UHK9_DESTI|nr:hypothetical protein [Desulfonispora thiosulfatigenes]SMB80512.1 hypothetical protein SAMN00017405_0892 [Desulfonispora thiosulfatigenes DSM 11270]